MSYLANTADTIVVDLNGVRSASTKAEVENAFSRLGRRLEIREGIWHSLIEGRSQERPGRFIVVTDLSTCALTFKDATPQRWATAIRSAHPYIVAFVRNQRDERYAAWVDDIVQASDNRITVCSFKKSHIKNLTECLSRAVAGTAPNSLINVRFVPQEGALWLEFGDGLKASLEWSRLNLDDVTPPLLPESAAVGDDLDTIRVLKEDGVVFEIDASAVRAFVDQNLSDRIEHRAARSAESVGRRLREKREQANLTQTQLAEKCRLDQPVISKLERGRHRPRFDTLSKYARGLGMSVAELLR